MNGDTGPIVVSSLPPTPAPHQLRHTNRLAESGSEHWYESTAAPDLRQDFNRTAQTKRVSMILQSPSFCEELEMMIQEQLKKGKNPSGLLALQQVAEFISLPSTPTVYPAPPQAGMAALNMSLGSVSPVNDLRGSDSVAYEKGEKLLRCKLAAFHRLADLLRWSRLIYNHLTVRLDSEQERFLIVPFGLLYSEVTASSLMKVNLEGEIVDGGSTNFGVNQAGFTLHSAIYSARPDVKCIVHIQTPAGAAVSAMKCGLLPISPEALSLGEVAYHDYQGILVEKEETMSIQKSLGSNSKVLILRNHGLVSTGETVEEAFYYIQNLVTACEIQVRTLASTGGLSNLVMLDPAKYRTQTRCSEPSAGGDEDHGKWLIGEKEFEAFMRMLDNLGYRTGYPYRCSSSWDKAKRLGDSEARPSSAGYSFTEGSKTDARPLLRRSSLGWQRERTLQPDWVRPGRVQTDGPRAKAWTNATQGHVKPLLRSFSSGVCVPSCLTTCLWTKEEGFRQTPVANQFVPLNTNPKEVQEIRNKIREQNLQDVKTAGPQSQVLSGPLAECTVVQRATIWQDAPLSDCTDVINGLDLPDQANGPAKGELVTASKAIIEKEFQPRVSIRKTGPNPFSRLTDQELEEYHKEVERKQKGPEALVSENRNAEENLLP